MLKRFLILFLVMVLSTFNALNRGERGIYYSTDMVECCSNYEVIDVKEEPEFFDNIAKISQFDKAHKTSLTKVIYGYYLLPPLQEPPEYLS